MNGWTLGFWDVADRALWWVGKGVARFFMRKSGRPAASAAYTLIGGAIVGALFGGALGFALSDYSRNTATLAGAIIGGLLGACQGAVFGSFVETVDGVIKSLIRDLPSRPNGISQDGYAHVPKP